MCLERIEPLVSYPGRPLLWDYSRCYTQAISNLRLKKLFFEFFSGCGMWDESIFALFQVKIHILNHFGILSVGTPNSDTQSFFLGLDAASSSY